MDQGFSRGTKGLDVASFVVKKHKEIYGNWCISRRNWINYNYS
jgi:D-ornithine 4,5-aminomutase subunit beta